MIPAQPADSAKTTFATDLNQGMTATATEAVTGNELEVLDPASAKAAIESVEPPEDLPEPCLTDNAKTVLGRRYLKKSPETGEVIETPRQLFWRVASHVARAELSFNAGAWTRALVVARDYYILMAERRFMPNSPCLMNAGREMGMLSACFPPL